MSTRVGRNNGHKQQTGLGEAARAFPGMVGRVSARERLAVALPSGGVRRRSNDSEPEGND